MRELVTLFGADDLPTIGDVNPYVLGATASVFGNAHDSGRRDPYSSRTRNQVDSQLTIALTGPQMVLVVGPPKVGKTRTLYDAIRPIEQAARVLVPAANHLREVVTHPRIAETADPIVVWLDDLHEYLDAADPFTSTMLSWLTARRGRTMVVATLRTKKLEQLRGESELQRDIRLLLEQALTIRLASTGEDPDEHFAAVSAYPAMTWDRHGLGEFLNGGPELTEDQRDLFFRMAIRRNQEDPTWSQRQAAAGHRDAIHRIGIEAAGGVSRLDIRAQSRLKKSGVRAVGSNGPEPCPLRP
ncbi:hypothetical protein [Nocardia fluminea]|uniref:hypothetical protein n=1 Tax=Nocardia fluminea TaxID=134984 RepID=UPI003649C0A4